MLNIDAAGTALSTYYLDDPGLFLRDYRDRAGTGDTDGVRHARRELRRLAADIDETTTLGQTRSRVLNWLACFGWQFPTRPATLEEPVLGCDGSGTARAWMLVTPSGQHLDMSPTGRRAGKLRPQRQAEVAARSGTLPAVLLTNGSELRVIRRDPGLGGEASYLTIDLPGLAALGDNHEWSILWALLRPEAFTPDSDGQTLWDALEKASSEAAEAVSEDLSGGVRTAITAVANGALDALRQNGQPLPEPRALFADAMRIAYRLLFVAYAEDRGLLPVGTPAYDSGYSLRTVRDLAADLTLGWEPDGGYLWAALRAQWAMLLDGVDAGDLQIPGFDGGLFDPAKCPILDDPALIIGDTYVRDLVNALCWTQPALGVNRRDQVARRRVNYRELGVEQLGSIYEGLLAFEPQIAAVPMTLARLGRGQTAIVQVTETGQVPLGAEVLDSYPPGTFYLFEATGQRKGSGSYYTPRQLAHFVVGETLRPLTEAATPQQILSLRIVDPAMGSGGFLVPAVHWLTEAYGEALARAGEDIDHKLDDHERAAYRRLIVERCIYGVDLNPMAVELAKVSLWLATAAAGKPLSFLDAHLRCGNALVGAALASWESIPPVIRGTREADPDQGYGMATLFDLPAPDLRTVIATRNYLAAVPSDDRLQVRAKERDFARMVDGDDFRRLRELGDWWITPFYSEDFRKDAATWRRARRLIERGQPFAEPGIAALFEQTRRYIRDEIRPFHWEIEFPEVFFKDIGERRDDHGFDAIVGNPPWEGITFKAREFYGRFDPSYAFVKTKSGRQERQAGLRARDDIAAAYGEEDHRLDGVKSFIKNSGQYRLLYSHGTTFNYYRVFLEQALTLLAPGGRLGFIIDSGVVSDAATAEHRRELLSHCTIAQFVLCDNVNGIFPIDTREQFLLLVAAREGFTDPLPFTAGVDQLEDLLDLERRTIPISQSVLRSLAPETLAVPDTRDPALLDLLAVIYNDRPLLLDLMPEGGWRIDWGREFDLHDDRAVLSESGTGAPLREGKHIHQFTSEFAEPTYHLHVPEGEQALLRRAMKRAKLKGDPYARARRSGERALVGDGIRPGGLESPFDQYRLGFRETANRGNERTLIAAIIPPGTAVTHGIHYFYRSQWNEARNGYQTILPAPAMAYLAGLLNSLVLDFVVRRKVDAHVTKSVMATVPIADVALHHGPGAEIVTLSARLSCRSAEYAELAEVLGTECGPISRARERAMRAEIDARVAHLYGLSAAHLDLVLANFKQSADSEGSPVRPDDDYKDLVRREYRRLAIAEGDSPAA
jgi:hypothetical protein